MKLDRVRILNFRSIKDVTISFEPSCRVLVGINESGKSNILRALAMLNESYNPIRVSDLRDALPDEDEPITKSEVEFIFKFNDDECRLTSERARSKILAVVDDPAVISAPIKKSLRELCMSRNEGLYTANILSEKKLYQYWTLPDSYKLAGKWYKPTSNCPAEFEFSYNGKNYTLSKYKLIESSVCDDINPEYITEASVADVGSIVGDCICDIVKEKLPNALFWHYDEANLLPNSVKISSFIANPDVCKPLKNMFILAGISDIKKGIENAQKGSDNQFQNFLGRIAKKTTDHFQEVWSEYTSIEFSLRFNGDQIIPGIKEHNTHDFKRRSDGFKRFVTFLLMISVNVKTENLSDTLLLVDEPDMSLHPSGARYLRDELLKISNKNYVIYSTHSIFMIDPSDISRHYIVKKNNEITKIESAGASNIADEEILYNALGYSVFSILKANNLIFEGWTDKKLFQIALENSSAAIKKKFADTTPCHAKGVKSIKAITPMIELAKRNCIIISDCDKPALDQQKQYQREKGYGEWKTYKEIDTSVDAVTSEDFIKNDFLLQHINESLSDLNIPLMEITSLSKTDKIATITKWLQQNGINGDQAKETLAKIKVGVFENLTFDVVEGSYTKILKSISFS